jgi:hypothetical protein
MNTEQHFIQGLAGATANKKEKNLTLTNEFSGGRKRTSLISYDMFNVKKRVISLKHKKLT